MGIFSFSSDPEKKRITAHVKGMFSLEEVIAFTASYRDIVTSLGYGPGEFDYLVILEDSAVQPQPVVSKLMEMAADPINRPRRAAIVQASALTRMQTKRITATTNHSGAFLNLTEAEEWLDQE